MTSETVTNRKVLLFTQSGCFSCELMKVFLEAKEIVFEECDITDDPEARRTMTEQYGSGETPTIVVFLNGSREVVKGFDPVRLDQLLDATSSTDSVTEA